MSLLHKFYSLKGSQLLIIVVSGNLLFLWLTRNVLLNELVFYNTYSEQLTYERAIQLFENMKHLSWLGYIFGPLVLLIKFSLTGFVLFLGIFFSKDQATVPLHSIIKVVIASEMIFVLGGLIKFLWFYLFAGNYSLADLQFFYPLSLLNIFRITEIEHMWVYPLQTINLFHGLYLLLLSFGLSNVCKINRSESDRLVLVTYLPALLLWITFIMFLSVSLPA